MTRSPSKPANGKPLNGKPVNGKEPLPPHDASIERVALGCVIEVGRPEGGAMGSQAQVEQMLLQLRPDYFYDLRHKSLYSELCKMRMGATPVAVDLPMVLSWLKQQKRLEDCGGFDYVNTICDDVVSVWNFPSYAKTLDDFYNRRWALSQSARMAAAVKDGAFDMEMIRADLSDALEKLDKGKDKDRPSIEVVTLADIQAYVPDPKTFLVGADMISLGEFSIIAGLPEAGKSMLGNTLAFAGARGPGEWMGYEIRRKFRSFVLQSEGSMRRMQKEMKEASASYQDWVRFTKPCHLAFGDAHFRQSLRRQWEEWPFDLLIIDNWSDCVTDDKFTDYQLALDYIRASLPSGDRMPAVLIIAHLSKAVIKADKPLTGRALMAHVSGSFRIGQKARTVFTLVRAFPQENDDDLVIFDCAKANNDTPQPFSAWHRRPVRFQPASDFDFEEWLNPPEDGGKRGGVTEDDMRQVLQPKAKAKKSHIVTQLKLLGYSQATAYRAVELDKPNCKFKDILVELDGFIQWR